MQTGCLNLACSSEMQPSNMYIIYFKDYDIEELYFNISKWQCLILGHKIKETINFNS